MPYALSFAGNNNTLARRVGPFALPTNFTQSLRIDVTLLHKQNFNYQSIINTPDQYTNAFFVGHAGSGPFYFWSAGSALNSTVTPVDNGVYTISITVSTAKVVGISVNGGAYVTQSYPSLSSSLLDLILSGGTMNIDGSGFKDAFVGQLRRVETWVGGVKTGDYTNTTGTGATMPSSVGAGVATQAGTWPADNSEWTPFRSPTGRENIWRRFPTGRITGSAFIPWSNAEPIVQEFFETLPVDGAVISFSMPQMGVAVAASKTVPVRAATVSFAMPQMSVAVAASNAAAGVSASVAFTMPQMTVSAAASKTVPIYTSVIAVTMPQMTAAVSAGNSVPIYSATVSATMPQMQVAASGSNSVSGVTASISVTMPQMQAAISASKSVPAFGASIAFAMPQMSVAASASKVAPSYPASVSVSMPQMTVAATASNYVEGVSAAVTFTMPQMRVTAYTDGVIFYAADTAHVEQQFRSRSITQLARSVSLYAVARSSHINQIAKSRHIAYNYQSTHIEKRSA